MLEFANVFQFVFESTRDMNRFNKLDVWTHDANITDINKINHFEM